MLTTMVVGEECGQSTVTQASRRRQQKRRFPGRTGLVCAKQCCLLELRVRSFAFDFGSTVAETRSAYKTKNFAFPLYRYAVHTVSDCGLKNQPTSPHNITLRQTDEVRDFHDDDDRRLIFLSWWWCHAVPAALFDVSAFLLNSFVLLSLTTTHRSTTSCDPQYCITGSPPPKNRPSTAILLRTVALFSALLA